MQNGWRSNKHLACHCTHRLSFTGQPFFVITAIFQYTPSKERPLLHGVPSSKIVHRTIFKFTLCGALKRIVGRCPTPCQRRCLWNPLKGCEPFRIPSLVLAYKKKADNIRPYITISSNLPRIVFTSSAGERCICIPILPPLM